MIDHLTLDNLPTKHVSVFPFCVFAAVQSKSAVQISEYSLYYLPK